MKVLSEYPEVNLSSEQQNASLGETFAELMKRLDEGISLIWPLDHFPKSDYILLPCTTVDRMVF